MIVRVLGFVLGIASLGYFGMYAIFAGLTNKFTYFWLLFGVICLLFAATYQHLKKWVEILPVPVKAMGIAIIGICVLILVIVEGIIISYGMDKPEPGADYVIVLGAQVRGTTPSYNLARRLDVAYEYLEKNPDTMVILSGGKGQGEEISEAQAMYEYLLSKGINEERMIQEDKSRNTHENIQFSKEIIKDENARIVLVTNDFHIYRSVNIAEKQGLNNVEGLGSPVKWYTIPNQYLREAFAVVKYTLCGQM